MSRIFTPTACIKKSLISAAHFDLAGTVVDPYCLAPLIAFREVFLARGINLTTTQITGPMGISKIAHIRHLLSELKGESPRDALVDDFYKHFMQLLPSHILTRTTLTPQVAESIHFLREKGIHVAGTSGYPRDAATLALSAFHASGLQFDALTVSGDRLSTITISTRIEMIRENQRKLGLSPENLQNVILFTDAKSDVLSARSDPAGPFVIGVSNYSTHVGVADLDEEHSLDTNALTEKRAAARRLLLEAGAHAVIDDLHELPCVLALVEKHLMGNQLPTMVTHPISPAHH